MHEISSIHSSHSVGHFEHVLLELLELLELYFKKYPLTHVKHCEEFPTVQP